METKMRKNKGKILVTGGAGFIGSRLCERLIQQRQKVICLDNFNDFYNPKIKEDNISNLKNSPNFSLIRGDILDKKLLEKIFSENQISKIIHLAALPGVRASFLSPENYIDVDIKGTVNLLEMAKKYKISQFTFGSSSSVYGEGAKIPFQEDEKELIPISPYSNSKRAAEIFCQTYSRLYKIPTTILRIFTAFGPCQRPEMAIHKFVRLMKQGKAIPLYGKEDSVRDYTFIDDVVEGIIMATKKNFDFEIFNLGNSKTVKLEDLIKILSKKLKIDPKIEKLPGQLGDLPITFAEISKAKRLLGWQPKIPFEEGIEKFLAWHNKKEKFLNKLNLI